MMTRQLATLVHAGIPLVEAVSCAATNKIEKDGAPSRAFERA